MASATKSKRVYSVDFIFADFTNDHVQVFIDSKLVLDQPMSVATESETTGFTFSKKFDLKECSHIEIKARRFTHAETVCMDDKVKAIFFGGAKGEPRIKVSHGELGFD